MKGVSVVSILFLSLLLGAGQSFAGPKAVVSIRCDEADRETKIFLNGQYKGDCSNDLRLNLFLKAGEYQLEAVKAVDGDREQTFKKTITANANIPVRLSLVLSAVHLTEAGEKDAAEDDLRSAEGGNVSAMQSLAQRYKTGQGVRQDEVQASEWEQKAEEASAIATAEADLRAAQQGDKTAMAAMVQHYEMGKGVQQNESEANAWRMKIAQAEEKERQEAVARSRAEREQREKQEAEQQAAKAKRETERRAVKRESLEKELYKHRFLADLRYAWEDDDTHPILSTVVSPFMTVFHAVSLPFVLIFTEPGRTTDRQKIQREIDTLASAWAKPDSLMARVHAQQQGNGTENGSLVAAGR